jgi:hypothetical protein
MDRDPPKPHKEFRFVGPTVDARGVLRKYPLRVGGAESLTALLGEHVFFTPAALYLHGGLTDGPLIDFIYEVRENVRFYYKKFNRPVFRGLEDGADSDWNHVLWAVSREHWEALARFMLSVTLFYPDERRLARFAEQELVVLDPLSLDRSVLWRPDLPVLPVSALGVNASDFRMAFDQGPNLLMDTPSLRRHPPDEETRIQLRALMAGHNPLDATLNHRNRKLGEGSR